MNVRNLFTDDDAVSPVIGVILMVAITVILAAVIGAFVLNIGGSQSKAPQATMQWKYNSDLDVVNATHQSGEKLPQNEVDYSVDGTSSALPGDLAAGDKLVINDANSAQIGGTVGSEQNITPGNEIKLIWNSPSSDKSSVISSYTAQ